MKGVWGKVAKWLVGIVGAAALALVTYMVEHGELPAWLSRTLNNFSAVLTITTPWAVWELLLPILIIGGVSVYLLLTEAGKIQSRDDQIAKLSKSYQSLNVKLESESRNCVSLQGECESLAEANARLEASNKELLVLNAELNRKLGVASQVDMTHELNSSLLNEEQVSVFEFVGERADAGQKVTKLTVVRDLRVSLLTAEDILDKLCDLRFIKKVGGQWDAEWYVLTKAGRSCFLERRKGPVKPPTRHG